MLGLPGETLWRSENVINTHFNFIIRISIRRRTFVEFAAACTRVESTRTDTNSTTHWKMKCIRIYAVVVIQFESRALSSPLMVCHHYDRANWVRVPFFPFVVCLHNSIVASGTTSLHSAFNDFESMPSAHRVAFPHTRRLPLFVDQYENAVGKSRV